jgi:hypothetical protein
MGRRVAVLVVTGLLAAVLTAGSVAAQPDRAQPTHIRFEPSEFLFEFPDPCNPQEGLTITGTSTGFITEVRTPTGDYIYTLHQHLKGTVVGTEGTEGTFTLTSVEKLKSEDPASDPTDPTVVYTAESIFLINNLGSGPNYVAQGVAHVTGLPDEPVVQFFFEHAECRG